MLLVCSVSWNLVYTTLFLFDCETSIFFTYLNHARIRSWNQPVLRNEGKVSCSRKQREPLKGFRTHEKTGIPRLRVR